MTNYPKSPRDRLSTIPDAFERSPVGESGASKEKEKSGDLIRGILREIKLHDYQLSMQIWHMIMEIQNRGFMPVDEILKELQVRVDRPAEAKHFFEQALQSARSVTSASGLNKRIRTLLGGTFADPEKLSKK